MDHAASLLLHLEALLEFQDLVRRVPVPDHIYDYVVEMVRMTRPSLPDAPDWIKLSSLMIC